MVSVTQSPFVTCCWLFCCRELRVNGRVCYTHRAVRLSKQGVAFAHAGLRRQVGLGDLNGLYLWAVPHLLRIKLDQRSCVTVGLTSPWERSLRDKCQGIFCIPSRIFNVSIKRLTKTSNTCVGCHLIDIWHHVQHRIIIYLTVVFIMLVFLTSKWMQVQYTQCNVFSMIWVNWPYNMPSLYCVKFLSSCMTLLITC